jgi:hypothetical protein
MPGRLARHRVAEAVGSRHCRLGSRQDFYRFAWVSRCSRIAACASPLASPWHPPWHPLGIDRNVASPHAARATGGLRYGNLGEGLIEESHCPLVRREGAPALVLRLLSLGTQALSDLDGFSELYRSTTVAAIDVLSYSRSGSFEQYDGRNGARSTLTVSRSASRRITYLAHCVGRAAA